MKTKILIVDDSRIFRSAVAESLASFEDIEVIGSVWNGSKAIEFIRSHPPDLVTLDVEMPDMDGIETLAAIQKINADNKDARPVGVIMLSSHTREGADITIKALEMGAFDFIQKPEGENLKESFEILRRQLAAKIRNFAVEGPPAAVVKPLPETISKPPTDSIVRGILIGVSTGGPKALAEMLPSLCEKTDVPIFVVQHMPPTFTQSLAKSLNAKCRHAVIEGRHHDVVRERHVYIAPGGRHMLLGKRRNEVVTVVNDQPPVNGCRPSVDILFKSGATVYGQDAVAVILTGMGTDGTEGARILKRTGAVIIAQDEATSVVWGMPGSACASGNVDQVLPLAKIPAALGRILQH
ncbi:MAG: chemotaxis response regulator protein-glutamate methylesterase [Thermodesulfobacteriota bacterium]